MKKQVLFVDDEPNFLNGVRRMLRGYRDEWELSFAQSVDEAVETVANHSFDTIVSDVSMPGKTGLDLLKILKEKNVSNVVPVIILTGNAESDLKRSALDLGATDLLNKPVTQEDLIARIRNTLRLKEFQDALRNQNEILDQKVKVRTAELEVARRDIIWRLAKAGEYRDEETGDHVIRVANCSRRLAETLELSEDECEAIFLTSPLHDVGKIGIPDKILLKPGKLTPEERKIMESHCEIGAAILQDEPKGMNAFINLPGSDGTSTAAKDNDNLRQVAVTIAMSHHEKWNGKGYPKGLSGNDIPVSGLIVAIADVFDALRSERPYKEPYTYDETLELMRSGNGSHFAPHVFDAFLSIAPDFEEIRTTFSE
jgi:response regulator RpfG family c-di-GMP phosphodiesterase